MLIHEELIKGKYLNLKNRGETEGFLDEKHFGEIKLFINKKPESVLFPFKIDDDIVYIGS